MNTHPSGAAGSGARALATAFVALLVPTFCLIVLGALVRAHEAGLACPDWPLCFGRFVPEMNLKVGFEWSHRVLAGAISLGFVALATIALRRHDTSPGSRRLVLLAGALLALQVLLGALTVWQLLAAWSVTSHLITGNAFALSLLFIALSLRRGDEVSEGPRAPARLRVWLGVAGVLLLAQLVLGGLVSSRFAGLTCPEWPACNGGVWFPTWRGTVGLHLLHRWNAVLVVGAIAAAAFFGRSESAVRPATTLAAVLVFAQMGVGIANVLFGIPVEVTGLHSALATALVLTLGAATEAAWRRGPHPRGARSTHEPS